MFKPKRKSRKKKKIHKFSVKEAREAVKRSWGQILLIIICITLIVMLGRGMKSFLLASEYFNVTEIEVVDQEPDAVEYSLARVKDNPNIFKINLGMIADNIEYEHSDIQKAIVKRVLPGKLVVEVLRRRPVAQIAVSLSRQETEADNFFTVNKDGYILSEIGPRPSRDWPVIYGCNLAGSKIEIGHSYAYSNLKYALDFLKWLDESGFSHEYKVTKIDITEPRSMMFYIKDTLEVRIGDRKWKEKIENLAGILKNMDIDYRQKYYVDLRFKDFVFGKK
ncbi:MAG: cell division protein FtsQ/DivIB [Candidatus Omnitrophica bacterium]|nr:cell division protein FtsQ/DivIB [Candidatus Omnitrophota bacterium]